MAIIPLAEILIDVIIRAAETYSFNIFTGGLMNFTSRFSLLAMIALSMTISLASAFATTTEQTIATVAMDDPKAPTYKLVVETNDGREIRRFFKDVYTNGVKVRRDTLDQNALKQNGLILEQRDKHVLMRLKSNNFNFEQGGYVTIDTLFNGATGERRSYEVQIAVGQTQWNIFQGQRTIREIFIQTNRVMIIGAVGIKNLVLR